MTPFSKDYGRALEESKAHHQRSKTWSGSLAIPHIVPVMDLANEIGATSLLDYGCGKGLHYERPYNAGGLWPAEITKYDPAWPEYAAEPTGKFDIVVCTHVLGSIPLSDLRTVIDRLYSFAIKAIYVGEIIGPVKKKVFSRPELHPFDFDEPEWRSHLRRPGSPVRVVLATLRTIPDDQPWHFQEVNE